MHHKNIVKNVGGAVLFASSDEGSLFVRCTHSVGIQHAAIVRSGGICASSDEGSLLFRR